MSPHTPRPLVGILFVVLATLAFGVSDVVTKHLAVLYPVPVILAVRYVINLALLLLLLWPAQRGRLWKTDRFWLVVMRAFSLAAGSLTMGWALKVMPVGETVAIIYLAPFAVMLLSSPFLGEKVSTAGWAGAAFGFAGVLLIARPGGNLDPTGVFFALVNAALATAYHLLTRLLSRTETTVSMLFHTAWVGAAIFCALAIPDLGGFAPGPVDIGLMVLLGGFAMLGLLLFTAAYREAPASLLAPVNYLHLVWAGGLGWLVFSHIPDGWSLLGMALVTFAGAVVAYNSHRQQRRDKANAEAAAAESIPAD